MGCIQGRERFCTATEKCQPRNCARGLGSSWQAAWPLSRGCCKVLTADLIESGIGNLASPKVQTEVDALLDGVEFLVLDNLSSLTTVIRDNDAESWNPIQEWLLRLRRRGVSVLIIHHAGKGGEQRGTSRREDVLDTSLSLRRPSDYQPTEGARFEVHFEKTRGIHGDGPSRSRPIRASG